MSLNFDRDLDTICALSTAPGRSGIAVIRVSGSKAVEICAKLSSLPSKLESGRTYYSWFFDTDRNELDECVLSYFSKGRSFTGEDTVEISCHGNPLIIDQILKVLVATGARMADRGEFTYRAFMNGRIDLVQAESVLGLIEGQSRMATGLAARQLRGALSEKLVAVEDRLTWSLAHMQAAIDFSTEDIGYIEHDELKTVISEQIARVSELLSTFKAGKIVRDGLRVAILGPPNAGKSSLLNALLSEDRAIVTEIPGTTRDVIEGQLFLGGISVVLMDTAGLRETNDQVERLGIQRSVTASRTADVILYVFDSAVGLSEQDRVFLVNHKQEFSTSPLVLVGNKSDLSALDSQDLNIDSLNIQSLKLFKVSSRTLQGIEQLKEFFVSYQREQGLLDLNISINSRHFDELRKVVSLLEKVRSGLDQGLSPEFVTFDLQEALGCVLRVLGKSYDDQVLDRVFKEFCLGK